MKVLLAKVVVGFIFQLMSCLFSQNQMRWQNAKDLLDVRTQWYVVNEMKNDEGDPLIIT